MALFKRTKKQIENNTQKDEEQNNLNNDNASNSLLYDKPTSDVDPTYAQWLKEQEKYIKESAKKINTDDLMHNTYNTPTPIPDAINEKLAQTKQTWKKKIKQEDSYNNVEFDINSIIDYTKEEPHKQFYLNLHYLLTFGFNTLMCFNSNPFALDNTEDKYVTEEDKETTGLTNEQLKRRGFNSLQTAQDKQYTYSGFNFNTLPYGQNSLKQANKLPITVLLHNWTMAFNEISVKNNEEIEKLNRLNYQTYLESEYKERGGMLKERIIADLHLVKMWINLPWSFQQARNINESPYLRGYQFPKLSADGDNDTSVNFFMHAMELKTLGVNFITTTKTNDINLLKQHYTSDSGKMAFKEELKIYEEHCRSFLDLIKSLPEPFNYFEYQRRDSTDSYGNTVLVKSVNFVSLLEQWNNVNFESMIHRNANSYNRTSFFLDRKSNKYQALKIKSLDELYKSFINAIFNIVKCLLYYEDANGNELDISVYLK